MGRKSKGRHPANALTARKVQTIKKPGRYADGGGLYLVVDDSGKRWVLRLTVCGKRRDMGLGGISAVSLSEAREKAREHRKIAKAGG